MRVERDERGALELRRAAAHRDHAPDPAEDPPLHGEQVVAPLVVRLPAPRAVHPPGVIPVTGLLAPVGVIELAHLVPQVDQGDPAGAHGQGVGEQDAVHRGAGLGLQTQQGRRGPADPAVTRARVVLEGDAVRKAPRVAPGVEGVEEAAVTGGVHTQPCGVVVGEGPADVVVAAHVVDPRSALGGLVALGERGGEQGDVPGGQGLPRERHLEGVVGQGALLGVDVADDLVRVDDRLRLELHGGRGEGRDGAERAQQVVDLRLGLARAAQLLPDEGHGVQAQHLRALVREEQHLPRHGVEDLRVGVVQVPLEAVERGPHPAGIGVERARGAPGRGAVHTREDSRVVVREDLPGRALERVRKGAVPVDPVEPFEVRVPRGRGPGPLVLVGGVVEHEVQHERDPLRAQLGGQLRELVHGPEGRVHAPVGGDRVAAVGVARGALVQGHEVQVAEPELPEVGDLLPQPGDRAGVAVHVAHPAHGLAGREPGSRTLALPVQVPEVRGALGVGVPRGQHGPCDDVPDLRAGTVDGGQGRDDPGKLLRQAVEEHVAVRGGHPGVPHQVLLQHGQQVLATGDAVGDVVSQHGKASSAGTQHVREQ